MSKTVHRIMGIMVSFTLALGAFSNVEARSNQPAASKAPVYAYYYLWWSARHWEEKLGTNYPYNASPLPLPAKTDTDGCSATTNYRGNQLLDVPTKLVSQDDSGAIEADIKLAKNAGLAGFWLNWSGDGTTSQTRSTVTYTRRLAEAFAASKRVGGFKNWVSYKAASNESANYIINDLNFLYNDFKDETAWQKIDGKPVVTFTGSRKYSNADVQKISNAVRDRIFLVGDEAKSTLTATRMAMFDAITYYWSSQDPYGNPQSFDQIKAMGDQVHAAGKKWYAPFAPGYNSILLTGDGNCVPRRGGGTMRALWEGNSKSNPDGWGLISWNEIAENTHIKPMQKWGNKYLDVLSALINSTPVPDKTTLEAPNGNVGTDYNPTYTWKKIAGVTWYYLWIDGPSGNIFKQWYESSAICNGDTCSLKPDLTLQAGKHAWAVQTWNVAGYGPWSTTQYFTVDGSTGATVPDAAALTSPSQSISAKEPTFTWKRVSSATWYYLWVDGLASGNKIKNWYLSSEICTGDTCSVTSSVTFASGNYRWWVQTWNETGYGPWSDARDFTVK